MADVNKAAEQQAQADHNSGQTAPNLSAWQPNARDAYQAQRDFLKKQEEAKKNT